MTNENPESNATETPNILELDGEELLPEFLRRPTQEEQGAGVEAKNSENAQEPAKANQQDQEAEEEPEAPQRNSRRAPVRSAEDLFGDEILYRAEQSGDKLRVLLPGKIYISLTDLNRSFCFTWSDHTPKIEKNLPLNPGAIAVTDCHLVLSEKNLLAIFEGDLNPQVAMLTTKVRVNGSASQAVYFFNLIAPKNSF